MAEPSVKVVLRLDDVLEEEEAVLSFRSFLHSIGASHYLSFFVEAELLHLIDESDHYTIQYDTSPLSLS